MVATLREGIIAQEMAGEIARGIAQGIIAQEMAGGMMVRGMAK